MDKIDSKIWTGIHNELQQPNQHLVAPLIINKSTTLSTPIPHPTTAGTGDPSAVAALAHPPRIKIDQRLIEGIVQELQVPLSYRQ